ncbi:hypothetical protein [Microbacterium sp. TPD7012]|nr:hypothetical protein [Microbacterium sp. TPD7012]
MFHDESWPEVEETHVGLNLFGIGLLARVFAGSNADLGNWLCKTLGICA